MVVALMRPFIGVLAYVAYSFIGPHSYTYGMARSFSHVQAIAICTLVGIIFSSDRKQIPKQREFALLVLLWIVFGMSTLSSIAPDNAFNKLYTVSKIFLMLIAAMTIINTEDRLRSLVKAIALSIGFYGLKGGLFVVASGGIAAIEGPENSFLQSNNALGMAIAMNVPLLFYLAKVEENKWLWWLMQLMFVFSYPAVAGTFSRGAWLGLAVATGLMVMKSDSRKAKITSVLMLVLLIAVIVPNITSQQLQTRMNTFNNLDEDTSAEGRFWTWTFCGRVGAAYPILGGGFDYYSREMYARFYPEFLERFPGKYWSCHSMWLTIWGELGVVGSAVWGGLLISSLLSLRKLKQYSLMHRDFVWVSIYADMLQLAFIVYMVCGSFLDIAYFEMYYFLVSFVILLKECMHVAMERKMLEQVNSVEKSSMSAQGNAVFAG